MSDKFTINLKYGLAEVKEPKYWFEDGKIKSDTGMIIFFSNRDMKKSEAFKLFHSAGMMLG